jgi:hypothetical protein
VFQWLRVVGKTSKSGAITFGKQGPSDNPDFKRRLWERTVFSSCDSDANFPLVGAHNIVRNSQKVMMVIWSNAHNEFLKWSSQRAPIAAIIEFFDVVSPLSCRVSDSWRIRVLAYFSKSMWREPSLSSPFDVILSSSNKLKHCCAVHHSSLRQQSRKEC